MMPAIRYLCVGAALASGQAWAQQAAGGNVYGAAQLNQRQDARVVTILAIMPAKVEVSNAQNQHSAQVAGGLLGAVGGSLLGNNMGRPGGGRSLFGGALGGVTGVAVGSMVPGKTMVDGVSVTFEEDGHTYNSTQVGRACEFQPGKAVMLSSGGNETRVQANAVCPASEKSS